MVGRQPECRPLGLIGRAGQQVLHPGRGRLVVGELPGDQPDVLALRSPCGQGRWWQLPVPGSRDGSPCSSPPRHKENGKARTSAGHLAALRRRDVRDPGEGPADRLPINPSGRHSGCRPTIAADGALLVGTGDTASDPRISQDRNGWAARCCASPLDRTPAIDNPFPGSPVYTYGHRNVQGVAVRPGTGQVFTVEHGAGQER